MSYVVLGSDTKKQSLATSKQQAIARAQALARQQQQQQLQQQPTMPTPLPIAPPAAVSLFDSLMSAQNMPFIVGGGVLALVGGYALFKKKA